MNAPDPDRLAPTHGELRVVDDVPAAFAALVATEVRERPHGRPFRLACSGGATAEACYLALAGEAGIDWSAVELLVGDERCVPADDADANQAMIRRVLVEGVTPAPAFFPMDCGEVDAYDGLVASRSPIDLIHLGLGPDGHTASIFPGDTTGDPESGRLVVRTVDATGRNPHDRMSLTFAAIDAARVAVFTVAGEAKHDALARVLRGEPLPAARVRAGRVVWLCDREALGEDLGRLA